MARGGKGTTRNSKTGKWYIKGIPINKKRINKQYKQFRLTQTIPSNPVIESFAQAGIDLYIVGGSVRDILVGEIPSDLDFTTPATPEKIREIVNPLGSMWDVGEKFGTVGVIINNEKIEITTFRTEQYIPGSRKPDVAFTTSLKEDLARRDFTVNAIAIKVPGNKIIDPFNGYADLQKKILRSPSNPTKMVRDDPLRILRAIRFWSVRSFVPDRNLKKVIKQEKDRLSEISVERCSDELHKILKAGGIKLASAIEKARRFGMSKYLIGIDTNFPISQLKKTNNKIALLGIMFYNVDTKTALCNLKMPNYIANRVGLAKFVANSLMHSNTLSLRSLIRQYDDETLDAGIEIFKAINGNIDAIEAISSCRKDSIKIRAPLPVSGHDIVALGISGPEVGKALENVTNAFLLNSSLTKNEALKLIV